jgi:hypothetical protein
MPVLCSHRYRSGNGFVIHEADPRTDVKPTHELSRIPQARMQVTYWT